MKYLINSNLFRRASWLSILSIVIVQCSSQKDKDIPDLILVNGNIITVDRADHIVEAIAIRQNKIIAVGTTPAIEALAGSETKRINLSKHTVTPGLLDSHIHFGDSPWSTPNMIELSYPNAKSIQDIKDLIAAKVKLLKPGEWIQGMGWDEGKLKEKRLIIANDLDQVSLDNPIFLQNTTGHYAVVNSVALRLASVNHKTANPPGGIIDRDSKGNPTGVLKESAMEIIRKMLPPLTIKDIEGGLTHMVQALNREGMTGVKDPTLNNKSWQAYQNILDSGKLNVRVVGLWNGGISKTSIRNLIKQQLAMAPRFRPGHDRLVSLGVKLFADGSGGARTAWVYEEWNQDITKTDKGNYGFPNINPDTLKAIIKLCHDAGIHVSTHAIGDRTIDVVIDSYQNALHDRPTKGLRHGIIHANIPSQAAMDKIQMLQLDYDAGYPEPSATFTWWIGDTYAGNFGERAKRLNPFASFKRMGIIWANGSDYTVTPFPARYGIWSAIARQPALGIYGGDPFGREESVDVRTALRAVTIWAAHQMFLEEKTGSIEIGKYADLAVWDRDLYSVPTSSIKDMKCLMTIFNGNVVYQSEDFE